MATLLAADLACAEKTELSWEGYRRHINDMSEEETEGSDVVEESPCHRWHKRKEEVSKNAIALCESVLLLCVLIFGNSADWQNHCCAAASACVSCY